MERFSKVDEISLLENIKNEPIELESDHVLDVQNSPKLKVTDFEIRQDPDDNMFPCSICKYRFDQRKRLRQHLHSHRKERPNEVFNIINVDSPFKCNKCNLSFPKKQELEMHSSQHNPVECEICHKVYTTKYALKYHYLNHMVGKPSEYDICDQRDISESHLKQHYFSHDSSKLHKCDVCHKYFPYAKQLEKHSVVHSKVKPFECVICKKRLSSQYNLKLHSHVHTKDLPFECEICHKRFSRKGTLNRHCFKRKNFCGTVKQEEEPSISLSDEVQ